MNKAAVINGHEAQYKTQAEGYLAEIHQILRQLSAERRREERRRVERPSIVAEVKAILQGA